MLGHNIVGQIRPGFRMVPLERNLHHPDDGAEVRQTLLLERTEDRLELLPELILQLAQTAHAEMERHGATADHDVQITHHARHQAASTRSESRKVAVAVILSDTGAERAYPFRNPA